MREDSRSNDGASKRARELASAATRPPIKLLSRGDYTTPHRRAEEEAIGLILAQAKETYPGVRVVIVPRGTALAELPKHAIALEPEYTIERASKRYRGTPVDQLSPHAPGYADVVEFIPRRHRALIWEVKRATVGGSPAKAAERAAGEAAHYAERFDISVAAEAEGYEASLGTRFAGPGPLYGTEFVRPGAILYGRGRTREPRPDTEPHPFPWGAVSWETYLLAVLAAFAAAEALLRLRGGGWPPPIGVPAFGHTPSPFGLPVGVSPLLEPPNRLMRP